MKIPLRALLATTGLLNKSVFAALSQDQESDYLCKFSSARMIHDAFITKPFYLITANFEAMQAASYAVIDDADKVPPSLISECKNNVNSLNRDVIVEHGGDGYVNSSQVFQQCGSDSVCTISFGTTFRVDESINLGALIVQGSVEWTDETQLDPNVFLCAGYVAVEGHGKWEMDLQDKDAFIYIKNNGATHGHLRTRAFGSFAMASSDYPVIDINGRELVRTWSLLAVPLKQGQVTIQLMHNPHLMGW